MARNHPAFSPTCAAVLLGALTFNPHITGTDHSAALLECAEDVAHWFSGPGVWWAACAASVREGGPTPSHRGRTGTPHKCPDLVASYGGSRWPSRSGLNF